VRKKNNEGLHNFYLSPDITKVIREETDTKFLSENVKVRDDLRDLGIGILKGTVFSHVDWIHIAQDTVQWWALVNMALNLQVPSEEFSFGLIQQILASHQESPQCPYHLLLKCS
jgi:hypothetical protein